MVSTKGILSIIKGQEVEILFGIMGSTILDNGKEVLEKEKGNGDPKMDLFMMVAGAMGSPMVLGSMSRQKVIYD